MTDFVSLASLVEGAASIVSFLPRTGFAPGFARDKGESGDPICYKQGRIPKANKEGRPRNTVPDHQQTETAPLSEEGTLLDVPTDCYSAATTDTFGGVTPMKRGAFGDALAWHRYTVADRIQRWIDEAESIADEARIVGGYLDGSIPLPTRSMTPEQKARAAARKVNVDALANLSDDERAMLQALLDKGAGGTVEGTAGA